MSKDKQAMRYGARLCCIYDWAVSGETDRTAERLGKADCAQAMRALWAFVNSEDPRAADVDRLWRQASGEFPGIGAKDVLAADKWVIPELVRVYGMQAREIKAATMLHERFLAEGGDLDKVAQENHVYKWEYAGWLDFGNRIPWLVVLAVESLEASKRPWKTSEVFRERDRIRREYAYAAGTTKK